VCLGSSPKRLEWSHPELVHGWLLVHSSPDSEPANRFVTLICPESINRFITLICTLEVFFVFLAVLPRCNAHIRVLFCFSIEAYLHHIVCLSRHPFGGMFEGKYRAAGG